MYKNAELPFYELDESERCREEVLADVQCLMAMHRAGKLGGTLMPEDVHPRIESAGAELCHYFSLGMSLNYQRDSYALWRAATAAFEDPETRVIFSPTVVAAMTKDELAPLLLKHRVGLQPVKHTQTWHALCASITALCNGDIRKLFWDCDLDIGKIISFVQGTQKKQFPYLSGPKIVNYWLYVMSQYTTIGLRNREALSVAPDTHVIQASRRLGLISSEEESSAAARATVASKWELLLKGTEIAPIDVHTPLWLWSKGGFKNIDP